MKLSPTLRLFSIALITALAFLLSIPLLIAAVSPNADTNWSDYNPGIGEWVSTLPLNASATASDDDGLTDDAAYRIAMGGPANWAAWTTTNFQVSGSVSTTRYLDITGIDLNDGENWIQYRITDTTGIMDESPGIQFFVDTTAPGSPIDPVPQPDGWHNVDDFGAAWTNPSDASGISGVWYKLGSAPLAANDGTFVAGDNIESISGISVGSDGEHQLWLWLADGLDNADHNSAVAVTLRLDTQRPGPLTNAAATPDDWTNVNSFDLTWTPPADMSGLSGFRYKLNAQPTSPDDGDFLASDANGYPGFSVPGDQEGEHQLWLWPVDGAGNSALPGDAVSVTLRLDMTAPGPPLTVPSVTPSGWQTDENVTYTVTWQNPSDLSGIAGACYKLGSEPQSDRDGTCVAGTNITQISGIAPPAPGSYHLFLWLEDAAGNIDKNSRQVALDAIQWDPIPPEIFIDPIGPVGLNDWYIGPIDVTIVASDVGSELALVEYDLDNAGWVEGRQVRVEDDGLHTLVARATDNAGNQTTTDTEDLNIDTVPPSSDAGFDQTPVYGDWFEDAVTVTLSATDDTSGPDYVEWRLNEGPWNRTSSFVVDEDGSHTLEFYAADMAGNLEETQSIPVNVDRMPPVTSYVILPGSSNGGWYTEPVTITLVPSDPGVGVAETYYRVNGEAWRTGTEFYLEDSGEYTIEFYSVDYMGHQEDIYSIPGGVSIDKDAPLAPIPQDVAPRNWSRTNNFSLTYALPPDLSGIAGAYYKVGQPPTHPTDGEWRIGSSSELNNVTTPGEGRFKAYVWLKDVAGNVDNTRHGVWEGELSLAYDATPPTTTAELEGTPGANGWFVSPVQVTLVPTDTLSGVESTSVSINGSPPINATKFTLSAPDKHTLRFSSIDVAGNHEALQLVTVRIDPDPPSSPRNVATSPQDWTQINSFSVVWSNPSDTSGIAAGYYKIGDPPVDENDGIRVAPIGVASGITVPAEGAWDFHFWLADQAGNADIDTRVTLTDALRYDGTAPTTTATVIDGTLSASGWYTSPVTVALTAVDAGSGVERIQYRVNDSGWVEIDSGGTILLDSTGTFALEYQAFDNAGNAEAISASVYKVDLKAPQPWFEYTERYQRKTSFVLSWNANDEKNGSGLYGFDLQSKDGRNGAWLLWGSSNVPDTSGRYYGNYGHRYFFRMRARDAAGNVSAWVELPWGVYIDALLNGDFQNGNLDGWEHTDPAVFNVDVISAPGPEGDDLYVVELGSPDYGPSVPPDPPGVPVGSAAITQTVRIPGLDVLDEPTLTLWYRVFTYDVDYSPNHGKWFDTIEVRLNGPTGELLGVRDGLPYEEWQEGTLADLGWRQASVELPRSWSGATATITIENWNRVDGYLNTWSQVSDVRIWEPLPPYLPNQIYLPQLAGSENVSAASRPQVEPPSSRRPSSGLR